MTDAQELEPIHLRAALSGLSTAPRTPRPCGLTRWRGFGAWRALELLAPHVPSSCWPAAPAVAPGTVDFFDQLTGRA
jgi:hypothetical protein